MTNIRKTEHSVESLFVSRWSPRAYDGKAMAKSDLLSMLEAARWAPSAYNIQPWRFIYAQRDDAAWPQFLDILNPFNASWAKNASALVMLVSDTLIPSADGGDVAVSGTHSFDAGAAWAQFALQATARGYQAHAMAGIHEDVARKVLGIPDHFRVEIAIAVGRAADRSILPDQLQDREQPSDRLALDKIAFAERFAS